MSTIDDIQFDRFLYEQVMNWAFLLYQLNEISAVIPIPDVNLISFIRVFDDLIECQELINRNPRKIITLFAYEKNIQQWLVNMNIPNNLRNIKIFCHPDDQFYINDWAARHRHRFNNTTFEIIDYEYLNHNLLSFGLEYIRRIRREFPYDNGILNMLDHEYEKICQRLGRNALQRANEEEERIRRSCEAQN